MARRKTHEEFVAEVKALVGEEYTVVSEYVKYTSYVQIQHEKCGLSYPVTPENFKKGKRCPDCSHGHKRKTTEKFKQEVFRLCGNEYEVVGNYKTNKTPIEFLHINCGEIHPIAPIDFIRGGRCVKCKRKYSKGELRVKSFLDENKVEYSFQKQLKGCRNERNLPFDFVVSTRNGLVAIEYDGHQHFLAVGHFGGVGKLRKTQRNDAIKTQYCADNGIPLIRIPYWDFDDIDAILTEKLLPLIGASMTQERAS